MEYLFVQLSDMLSGNPGMALSASFAWGILSIVLSPCHLASIPLIIGFVNRRESLSTGGAALLSTSFSLGILVATAGIGALTALLGRIMGDIGTPLQLLISLMIFLFGLHMAEFITLPLPGMDGQRFSGIKGGYISAFIMGVVMGTALGPCTFAFLAPLIGFTLGAGEEGGFALLLFIVYGTGHAIVIILAGTFTGVLQKFLHWNEGSRALFVLKRICGVLVMTAGAYTGFTALSLYIKI